MLRSSFLSGALFHQFAPLFCYYFRKLVWLFGASFSDTFSFLAACPLAYLPACLVECTQFLNWFRFFWIPFRSFSGQTDSLCALVAMLSASVWPCSPSAKANGLRVLSLYIGPNQAILTLLVQTLCISLRAHISLSESLVLVCTFEAPTHPASSPKERLSGRTASYDLSNGLSNGSS